MVTVIIPVYNGENYIENCLRSVMDQTFHDLQIIVVDDGSKDGTFEICKNLAESDKRIQILKIENSGVSHARNIGIDHAKGEYIQFVDGDDTILKDATEILVHTIDVKYTDLVVCGYTKILPEIKIGNPKMEKKGYYKRNDYLINTLKDPGHHYYGVVWNKLYKRQILVDNNIRFIEKACLGEDFIFNLDYMKNIKDVFVIKDRLYNYNCIKQGSLSRYEKNIEMCLMELDNRHIIFNTYKKTFKSLELYDKYKKRVKQYWLIYLTMNIYYIRYVFKDWDKDDIKEWKRYLFEDQDIIKCRETISEIQLELRVKMIWLNRTTAKTVKNILRRVK